MASSAWRKRLEAGSRRSLGEAVVISRDASLTLHDLGTRHSRTVGSGGDYGLIGFSTAFWNTSPYIVYDGASTRNETYQIFDAGTSYVGMPMLRDREQTAR